MSTCCVVYVVIYGVSSQPCCYQHDNTFQLRVGKGDADDGGDYKNKMKFEFFCLMQSKSICFFCVVFVCVCCSLSYKQSFLIKCMTKWNSFG